jgi:transposase-like protein
MPSGRGFFLRKNSSFTGEYAMSDRKESVAVLSREKTCPKCGQKYDIGEEFVVSRSPTSHMSYVCKPCRKREDDLAIAEGRHGIGFGDNAH